MEREALLHRTVRVATTTMEGEGRWWQKWEKREGGGSFRLTLPFSHMA